MRAQMGEEGSELYFLNNVRSWSHSLGLKIRDDRFQIRHDVVLFMLLKV